MIDSIVIGYDGKRAVLNFTGLGNYSRLIIESVADALPSAQLRVYTPRLSNNPRLQPMLSHSNVVLTTPAGSVWPHLRSVWRSYGITSQIKEDKIAIYHGLSGELPLNIAKAGIPTVVTVHDLIFRRHPEYYKPIDRKIYDYKFRRACHDSTRIIAISERTKLDIIEYYGIDPAKIDVIYQGCDPQFIRDVPAEEIEMVRNIYHLPQRYIVSVGTVEERKNQLLAVKALPMLPDDIKLVIVGRKTPYATAIQAYATSHALSHRITMVENAPFSHLPALYAGAVASSYTSRYEGFGIPVIESIGVRTPCVVATGSCLEEAGGPHTPAVDPDSPDALAQALLGIIDGTPHIAQMRSYISRFNATDFTHHIIETYQKAITQYGQRQ